VSRIFRCVLLNDIPGVRLQQAVPGHICSGDWTPGWTPPSSIDSGVTGAWQTERSWWLGGTDGYVKYDILNKGDGSKRGQLIIYWTNPYLGATYATRDIASMYTAFPCGDSDGSGASSSTFGSDNARPADLFLNVTGVLQDGTPSQDLGELVLPFNMMPTILATGYIAERAEWRFRLYSSSPPTLLPGPKPKTLSLETQPSASDFAGDWFGSNITVHLAYRGMGRFAVQVSDLTQAEALHFDSTTNLSALNTAHLLEQGVAALTPQAGSGLPKSAQLIKELGAAIEGKVGKITFKPTWLKVQGAETKLQHQLAVLTDARVIQKLGETSGLAVSKDLALASEAIASQTRVARYALLLRYDIVVFLIRVQEGDSLVDYKLRYQRVGPGGVLLVEEDLDFDLPLH
jgi:hypothetical protein